MTTTPLSPAGFRERLGDELSALAAERTSTTVAAAATDLAPIPASRRRRWARRPRLSLAIAAAAAAGVILTIVATHQPATPAQATAPDTGSHPQKITRIATAAYTLQREEDGRVRLAITDAAGKLLDTARLQRDLNRLGVPALVYAGDPDCTEPPTATADDAPRETWHIELAKGGKPVLSVRPDRIPAGQHLLVAFPLARTDPAHAGGVIQAGKIAGTPPSCVPAMPGSSRE
ncbi:hypothetical protein ACQEWB_30370 [Streptomyces sp. CA-249302]|uniref:hypothetical protein n=1 Tax=Streptomyces sp. CA-249302 TaxID=3240058 RepID=UPI003D8CEB80